MITEVQESQLNFKAAELGPMSLDQNDLCKLLRPGREL